MIVKEREILLNRDEFQKLKDKKAVIFRLKNQFFIILKDEIVKREKKIRKDLDFKGRRGFQRFVFSKMYGVEVKKRRIIIPDFLQTKGGKRGDRD